MVSIDFEPGVYRVLQEIADRFDATLALTRDGQVILYGSLLTGCADAYAKTINDDRLFPYGFAKAASRNLGLPPYDYIVFEF